MAKIPVDSFIKYSVTMTVRLDEETARDLKPIALFERKRVGTLVRDILVEKVQVYSRRPEYKKWRKDLAKTG